MQIPKVDITCKNQICIQLLKATYHNIGLCGLMLRVCGQFRHTNPRDGVRRGCRSFSPFCSIQYLVEGSCSGFLFSSTLYTDRLWMV